MAVFSYLQVNRICNQKCLFCSNPDNGKVLSLEQAKRHVDKLVREGCYGIIVTGGEPTIYEPLTELIAYIRTYPDVYVRLTTNGQVTSDPEFLKSLVDSGLMHLNLSLHSHYRKIQSFLSGNPDSLDNIIKTLYWAGRFSLQTDINMTPCKYNCTTMHETVRWVCEKFPFIKHFSWTNLDPFMNRVSQNRHVVHTFSELEEPMLAAMRYLNDTGRTFRMEKVPLCYMGEFAHCSTETRRIVKNEKYMAQFLDARVFLKLDDKEDFFYNKAKACEKCTLTGICAGLWEMETYYDPAELRTMDSDPEPIIRRILEDN